MKYSKKNKYKIYPSNTNYSSENRESSTKQRTNRSPTHPPNSTYPDSIKQNPETFIDQSKKTYQYESEQWKTCEYIQTTFSQNSLKPLNSKKKSTYKNW